MFKTKPRGHYLFATRKQKPRRRMTWLWVIISAALSLLVLELITRIVVDITGKQEELAQATTEPDVTKAYQLKFIDQEGKSLGGLSNKGTLTAQESLSVGYQLVKNQDNPYWNINEQGFRDRDPLPLVKPKNEVRIFILGGSTAFGYGTANNEATIAEQLETRLKQRLQQQKSSPQQYKPDTIPLEEEAQAEAIKKPSKIKEANYRVINAGVPGYASGNQLAQLALQILQYKPDFIVVLDGYSDLMLSGKKTAVQIAQSNDSLDDTPSYLLASASKLLEPVENVSYLATVIQNSVLQRDSLEKKNNFLANHDGQNLLESAPQNQEELQRRVDRYFNNHKQIVTLAAGTGASVVFAVQPEITGRNPSKLTPTEGEIATQLGRTYIKTIKETYPRFLGANQYLATMFPKNVKTLDLYNLSDKYPSPSFIDAIHLTETANTMVAEQLYYLISSSPKMQYIPAPPKEEKSK